MTFISYIYITPLFEAVDKGSLEIVKMLFTRPELNINLISIQIPLLT